MYYLVNALLVLAIAFFFVLPISRPITRRWLEAAVERQLLARAGIVRSDVV